MVDTRERDPEAESSGRDQRRPESGVQPPEIERWVFAALTRNLVPIFYRRAWQRLRSHILAFRLEYRGGRPAAAVSAGVEDALECADDRLAAGDIDGGWKCLVAAQRLALLVAPENERAAAVRSIRAELEKLSSWRRTAALDLLREDDVKEALLELCRRCSGADVLTAIGTCASHPRLVSLLTTAAKVDAARVVEAARIRDEHYHNEAYKSGLRRSLMLWLALALAFGIASLFVLARRGALANVLADPFASSVSVFTVLVTVATLGFLGSVFSAATSISTLHAPVRIPELTGSIRVTTLRLFIGPVSAAAMWIALQSVAFKPIAPKSVDGATLLTIAFAAGFTERLVARVVEAIAGR